ncbi:phospholipase D family protein [Evansella sp. LMS18]|uniref:phospholipase D-like domain-containing protein n=1 Tax=Evansella sp. LMS18 TaxID=2924033 RepID=UPI0020CFF8FC|nr:phospholipase D family protein [Evansella sp. LMS18]UTR12961.1 phospholipase D family protein [Evansella sp. LMS18]
MKYMKKTAVTIFAGVLIYILYAFITGAFIFQFIAPSSEGQQKITQDKTQSDDRVFHIEDRYEAGLARINLIENAQEKIELSYYTVHPGLSRDILFSSIIEAADRGVNVRILLDGMFHGMKGKAKSAAYAFTHHPNIELKYYEPFDPVRPWTWNNRLHDKILIADEQIALIGGRNIGDKYFGREGYIGASNDRDLGIINMCSCSESTVTEISSYYQYVWDHGFSQYAFPELSENKEETAIEKLDELRTLHEFHLKAYKGAFNNEFDWLEQSIKVDNISFIHNPVVRMNKEPWVWKEIASLIENAEESILIQSPYIIPTEDMLQYLNHSQVHPSKISILTNSLAATPNLLAYSGYRESRNKIGASEAKLYEYQGPDESLHAKTVIIDEKISVVGSFNLDPRSTFLSTEVMVAVESEELAGMLMKEIDKDIKYKSLLVDEEGEYLESTFSEKADVSRIKSTAAWLLSLLTRHFTYLL